jgi:hypothetical protein
MLSQGFSIKIRVETHDSVIRVTWSLIVRGPKVLQYVVHTVGQENRNNTQIPMSLQSSG